MPKQVTKPESDPLTAPGFANEDEIMLGMLTAIDRDANTSQRNMSAELGVALGLANAYLKRCARKGWIKVQQVPPRRYSYYLTPQGFAEKTRLTGQFLSSSFTFFRRSRQQMSDLLQECADKGWDRIAFAGISELAEIGTICAGEIQVELVGVVEPSSREGQSFYGHPVFRSIDDCPDVDAVVVTALNNPHELCEAVRAHVGEQRVLLPALVKLALPSQGRQSQRQVNK